MRIAGIVLLILGGLMVASRVVELAANRGAGKDGLSDTQLRMDAFFPGATVSVIGFVLTAMARQDPVVAAVAVEDWLPVRLTAAAAEFVKRAIVERKFAAETALRIEDNPASGSLDVKFDLPSNAESDVVGEDQGVTVIVDKSVAPRVSGKLIEFESGRLSVKTARAAL